MQHATTPRIRAGRALCGGCRGRSGLSTLAVLLLAAIALAVSSIAPGARAEEEPAATATKSAPKLLLLPIVVHSAEDPSYLREGLSDMLTARLARIGVIQLVTPDPNTQGTTQLDRARSTARRLGADYVLFGSFTRFGQGASLDVQCASAQPGGRPEPLREIFVHSGSIGDIIPDLDELAGKVSRFARGEVVAPSAPAASSGVAVSLRDYQALLARVGALEKSLSDLKAKKKREE
ncbi:hypothetical protein K2X89_03030 [Myxococcota bacterium]|nr:hypothetical protein [Myxococcota bacterium]